MTTMAAPRRGVFPGWVVVGATFLLLWVSSGFGFYGLAIYLRALVDERGFSTTSVSLGTSLFFIVGGLAGRLMARLIDTRDLRPIVVGGSVLAGLGMWAIGHVRELWQLYPAYALMAVGWAATGLVPATTLVTRWFHRRRSLALSISSTGLSVGGLTLTKLIATRIDDQGLGHTAPLIGLAWVLVVVAIAWFLWPTPLSRGTAPDGDGVSAANVGAVAMGAAYHDAVRSRFFKAFTVGYMCVMAAQVGGIAQLAKLGQERVDKPTGALAVSVLALSSVIARLVAGVVAPKLPLGTFTAGLCAGQGASLVLLGQAGNRTALLVAAALFGATVGNLLMLQPLVIAETFGVREYAKIYSVNQLVTSAGVAAGPFLTGWLRDLSGYSTSYTVAALLSFAGGGCVVAAGSVRSTQTAFGVAA
jgi:MFS family permease